MKRSIFVLLFLVTSISYADLIDSNCSSFISSGKYVRGSRVSTERTERVFDYTKMFSTYSNLNNKINQSATIASATCEGAKNSNLCLGLQHYCIEKLLYFSLTEDVEKWSTSLNNCQIPEYVKKFPKHCTDEIAKSLSAIALNIDKYNQIVNSQSDTQQYFTSKSFPFFEEHKNNSSSLKSALALNNENFNSRNRMLKLLGQCHGLTLLDNNNVLGKVLTEDLYANVNYQCESSPDMAMDTLGANKLRSDIIPILRSGLGLNEVLPPMLEKAFKNSLKAFWNSHLTYYGEMLPSRKEFTCNYIPNVCADTKGLALVESALTKFNDDLGESQIAPWSAGDISAYVDEVLAPPIKEYQGLCEQMNKDASKISDLYAPCNVVTFEHKDAESINAYMKCQKVKKDKQLVLNNLYSHYKPGLENAFSTVVDSAMGQFFLSDKFKDEVGTFDPNNIKESCAKNNKGLSIPKQNTVINAMKDIFDLNLKNIKGVSADLQKDKKNGDSLKILKKYVENNMLSVSEFLHDNPSEENALTICQGIRAVYKTDKNWKIVDGAVDVGLSAAAIAMTVVPGGVTSTPYILGYLGASSAKVATVATHRSLDKKQELYTRNAASAGEVGLRGALDKIDSLQKGQKDSLSSMISLLAFDVAGLGVIKAVKIFNGLKNSSLLIRLIRGKKTANQALDVKDLSHISKGLKTLHNSLFKHGVDPKLFSKLSGEQWAELGARVGSMKAGELSAILRSMDFKNVKNLSVSLLSKIRSTDKSFIVSKTLLARNKELLFSRTIDFNNYIARSEKVRNIIRPKSSARVLASKIKSAPSATLKRVKNYAKDVRRTYGGRILLKPGKKRKYKLTFLSSTVLWVGGEEVLLGTLNKHTNKLNAKTADTISKRLIGSDYAVDIFNYGGTGKVEFDKIMIQHNKDIENWGKNKQWSSLPRLRKIKQVMSLTDEEAQYINKLMLESYNHAYSSISKSDKKLTPKEALKLRNAAIVKKFSETLVEQNKFPRFNEDQLEILKTSFYPIMPIQGTGSDDVALMFKMTDPLNAKSSKVKGYFYSGMPLTEALRMTSSYGDSDSEKRKKVKEQLPSELSHIGDRIDFNIGYSTSKFTSPMSSEKHVLTDEVSRWKMVSTDSRFEDLYAEYKAGTVNEYETMLYAEATVLAYDELYSEIEKRKKPDKDVMDNFLMLGIKSYLDETALEEKWSEARQDRMQKASVAFWLDYYEKEARGKSPDIDAYSTKYMNLLNSK